METTRHFPWKARWREAAPHYYIRYRKANDIVLVAIIAHIGIKEAEMKKCGQTTGSTRKHYFPGMPIFFGIAAIAAALVSTGCANQGFRWTSDTEFSPSTMNRLVLRTSYSGDIASRIPSETKSVYESAFLMATNLDVRVFAKNRTLKPNANAYYLDAEVTKYKPGSPVGRFLITPVVAFGLWGSYVDVSFAIVDPANQEILGKGMVRKANLWGGAVGRSITAESQLVVCPDEILSDLHSFTGKQ